MRINGVERGGPIHWRDLLKRSGGEALRRFQSGRLLWEMPAAEFSSFLDTLAQAGDAATEIELDVPHLAALDNNLGRGVYLTPDFFSNDGQWNALFCTLSIEEYQGPTAARVISACGLSPAAAARHLRGTVERFRVRASRRRAPTPDLPRSLPVESKRLRVAFVCQPEYFRFMYERDLDDLYEVQEFPMAWGRWTRDYDRLIEFKPDVSFFTRPEVYPDQLLNRVSGAKVALSSEPVPKYVDGRFVTSPDMENRFNSLLGARGRYDRLYHFDRTSIQFLREKGLKIDGEFVFPVATESYRPMPAEKTWDVGFIGRDTPHRDKFLALQKRDRNTLHIAHGVYGRNLVEWVNRCRIVLNLHVDDRISFEPRMQLQMACGVLVISEPMSHHAWYKPNEHYVEIRTPDELNQAIDHYLKHTVDRERIAEAGRRYVNERLSARRVFPALIDCVLRGEPYVAAGVGDPAAAPVLTPV